MLVRLRNVEKSVPKGDGRLYLLRKVTLDVAKGDFLTLVGPSGAGKSTLLSILGLFDSSWEGEYEFAGYRVHELSHNQRQDLLREQIGIILQHGPLIDDMTISDNVELALNYHEMSSRERRTRVANVLGRLGLAEARNRYPRELAEDLQQLVAVGRALVKRPNVLLADEPTEALKSKQRRLVVDILKELNSCGVTIIQATQHEYNTGHGNRIVKILDGWLS